MPKLPILCISGCLLGHLYYCSSVSNSIGQKTALKVTGKAAQKVTRKAAEFIEFPSNQVAKASSSMVVRGSSFTSTSPSSTSTKSTRVRYKLKARSATFSEEHLTGVKNLHVDARDEFRHHFTLHKVIHDHIYQGQILQRFKGDSYPCSYFLCQWMPLFMMKLPCLVQVDSYFQTSVCKS